MKPTALNRTSTWRDNQQHTAARQQNNAQRHRAEAQVIESPADQSWISFCSTLAAPVLLLADLDWIES